MKSDGASPKPPADAGQLDQRVGRLWGWLKQRWCRHRFAIEDLEMVNPDSDGDDRVRWPCDECGKVFHAQCGLWISPGNGLLYRRNKTPNVELTGKAGLPDLSGRTQG